jgi:BirA family transcriptional regulator, biotin operon repressor / biotin---[acetyl-CoA-carboxylase] ligase
VLTRNKILHFFEGKSGRLVSGAELAGRLGITRASVWKHIQALQEMGLPIRSQDRTGYRFTGVPDFSLARCQLSSNLTSWATAHHSWVTPSTQVQAKQAAVQGIPEGHFWVAEIQNQGKGRLGRTWESGFGGLWFSLLLRPKLAPAEVAPLSLIAGLALVKALRSFQPEVKAKLKWPNDILVHRRGRWKKVAGILTEMSGEMDRTHWVALGIGINVNNALPRRLASKATSLQELTGKPWDRRHVLEAFLSRFRRLYLDFQKNGFATCKDTYWDNYFQPDAPVRLKTSLGLIKGIARGVDPRGGFIVESPRKHASARKTISTIFEGEIIL